MAGGGRLRNAPLRLFLEKWSEDCVPRSFAKMKQQSVLSRLPGTTPDSCFTHLEEEGDWHIAMCSINIWANVCSPSVLSVPSQDIFFLDRFPLVKWGKHCQVRNACQAFPLTLVSIVICYSRKTFTNGWKTKLPWWEQHPRPRMNRASSVLARLKCLAELGLTAHVRTCGISILEWS